VGIVSFTENKPRDLKLSTGWLSENMLLLKSPANMMSVYSNEMSETILKKSLKKIVNMNVDISETITDRKLGFQI